MKHKTSKPSHETPIEPMLAEDAADAESAPSLVRLNKYLADHGVASRRKCDELIAAGKVTVDGEPATELGRKVDPHKQRIEINGFNLQPKGLRRKYYLLNKPSGVVCTNEPRETRPRAVDLITDPYKGRIYTVGRLDEESKGLIILTNDGEFANKIMHPRFGIEKTYVVKVAGRIDDETVQKVREGVHLSEGRTSGARILVNRRAQDMSLLTLTIHEGMNREIRRVFARFGYKVTELRRVRIGPLSERGLKPGRWRELLSSEVNALLAGENEGAREPRRLSGPPKRFPKKRGFVRGLVKKGRVVPGARRIPQARPSFSKRAVGAGKQAFGAKQRPGAARGSRNAAPSGRRDRGGPR